MSFGLNAQLLLGNIAKELNRIANALEKSNENSTTDKPRQES